jgi:hypothetical protein
VSTTLPALRRGASAGLLGIVVLGASAFPARLSRAIQGWGDWLPRLERAVVGTLLDYAAVVFLLVPLLALLSLLVPVIVAKVRGPRWQRLGGALAAMPLGAGLWVLTVVAQEVKSERGSFPTMFDLAEGGTNASFIEGMIGFLQYQRIWLPALVGVALAITLVVAVTRRGSSELLAWRGWTLGLLGGLGAGALAVWLASTGLAAASNSFSPAALGDPLTGLVESSIDMARHKGPATARELVLDAELPPTARAEGARRLGWPPVASDGGCATHPYARPLDPEREPMTKDPHGRALVQAFERVSQALFTDDGRVAVFFVSLEGFRADDVHALNPAAPLAIAPFTSGLYEAAQRGEGVIASTKMFQAGVRTAHCLGAMMCGLGTLPYNLSFIRDLQPFPVRCTADVLADAGFRHAFFYGSDSKFDEMDTFLKAHRYASITSQAELPRGLPKGTWEGVTDFAVFDEAVKQTASALADGPQFTLLMSLSNHSPFTAPEDLPPAVSARVEEALKTAVNRADADDKPRLLTYSYTDAAVERLFQKLDETGLAERSIVVFMADHSTGHSYVWGPTDPETDAEKTQIPFVIAVPKAFRERAKDPAALEAAFKAAQQQVEQTAVSQNDVPTLLLALLRSHPGLRALPAAARWHTLGGQVTSPYFEPGGEKGTYLIGINGVSELYSFDRTGARVGGYEDSVFLKTRADRYRVTPRLIPVTATLSQTMTACPAK